MDAKINKQVTPRLSTANSLAPHITLPRLSEYNKPFLLSGKEAPSTRLLQDASAASLDWWQGFIKVSQRRAVTPRLIQELLFISEGKKTDSSRDGDEGNELVVKARRNGLEMKEWNELTGNARKEVAEIE